MSDTKFAIVQFSCGHDQTIEYRDIRELTCRPVAIHTLLSDLKRRGRCPSCSLKRVASDTIDLSQSIRKAGEAVDGLNVALQQHPAPPAEP